jgi:precorrin-2 dehydrogenase/sirohydrochlorin ferrochelatase
MIPVFLDPAHVRVALIGRGALAVRRLTWLRGLDAVVRVFSDAPSEELRTLAGVDLVLGLPSDEELGGIAAIWIADLPLELGEPIAQTARRLNVLVNFEDVKVLCAFHTPAIVQRGRLLLAAGTGGASPAAAALVRERLEQVFPAAWSEALEELAQSRVAMRAAGADLGDIGADARARLRKRALIGASPT